ncbi:MAG: hypothetical protein MZV64_08020 [Ignavibacteriales bacterium]|nr:hypothetical protein [Ignavibacteriales bacterium]
MLGYDYVEFYVGSAKMWAYWHAKAYGHENSWLLLVRKQESKDRVSYYLEQNNLRIVVTSAINPSQLIRLHHLLKDMEMVLKDGR